MQQLTIARDGKLLVTIEGREVGENETIDLQFAEHLPTATRVAMLGEAVTKMGEMLRDQAREMVESDAAQAMRCLAWAALKFHAAWRDMIGAPEELAGVQFDIGDAPPVD